MLLTSADKTKIIEVLSEAKQSLDNHFVHIRDGILWLRVRGNLQNGVAALNALTHAGINQVIDNDMTTNENSVVCARGAEFCTVWIDFVDHEPLFRDVPGEYIPVKL